MLAFSRVQNKGRDLDIELERERERERNKGEKERHALLWRAFARENELYIGRQAAFCARG